MKRLQIIALCTSDKEMGMKFLKLFRRRNMWLVAGIRLVDL